jgi:predicted GIY-YIG superfamily endonuclease
MTNEQAIVKLNSFGLIYDFSRFEYNRNRNNESIVICPYHGVFKCSYHNIIKSIQHKGLVCKRCRNENQQIALIKKYNGENFSYRENLIEVINKIPSHTINLDVIPQNIKYCKRKHRIPLTCKIHGSIFITYNTLLRGIHCKYCCGHTKHNKYWSKERLLAEALKYNRRKDFARNSPDAFKVASNENWLDEICAHMLKGRGSGKRKPYIKKTKWTYELCKEIAAKYQTKREFNHANHNAYSYAYGHGFLNEICTHMVKLGNRYFKCVYVYEFPDKSAYIGITSDFHRREQTRANKLSDSVTLYKYKTKLVPEYKQLTDYITVEKSVELETKYVIKYRQDGWTILNRAKTGGIGGDVRFWTYEKVMIEAKKYKTKTEFGVYGKGAVCAARKNGWYNECTAHMILSKRIQTKWTVEKCIESAKKCVTINEWKKMYSGARDAALRLGCYEDCIKLFVKDKQKHYKIRKKSDWTMKICVLSASKFSNSSDWQEAFPTTYLTASKKGWLEECTKHMHKIIIENMVKVEDKIENMVEELTIIDLVEKGFKLLNNDEINIINLPNENIFINGGLLVL